MDGGIDGWMDRWMEKGMDGQMVMKKSGWMDG